MNIAIISLLILFNTLSKKEFEKGDLQLQKNDTTYQKFCKDFLINLYNGNLDKTISSFDSIVIKGLSDANLRETAKSLSNKIREEYKGPIIPSLISSEKTIHENLPSTFLIFKIESKDMFGYYFFYMNDKTRKIILMSEFSRIKQKRK